MSRPRIDTDARPDSWRHRAACLGADPQTWFPPSAGSAGNARVVCFACPVRKDCGSAGASENEGVWAGYLLPDERDGLTRYLGIGRTCARCGRQVGGNRRTICHACTTAARVDIVSSDDEAVRAHIDALRDDGHTLTEIAAASGVSLSAVSRAAKGQVAPSAEVARRILALTPAAVHS